MTDLQWLLMAAERAKELPDPHLDWKWGRLGDGVIFSAREKQFAWLGKPQEPFQEVAFVGAEKAT